VDARLDNNVFCGDAPKRMRVYCHPLNFKPLSNVLYRNNGNGTFTDVSRESGVGAHRGNGLGVVMGDYDEDGALDVFVANDTTPNFLFHNCKEDGLVCENDFQCGANGPCLTESHCSETTTQLCTADNDCSLSLCPTCQPDERCDRILDVGLDLLFRGLNPGESVDLLQETVELKNILKGTAKIRETRTGNTFNAGSASDSNRYRIKGVPLQ
jgi:hypothetical protein